jgi:hypothetical protein
MEIVQSNGMKEPIRRYGSLLIDVLIRKKIKRCFILGDISEGIADGITIPRSSNVITGGAVAKSLYNQALALGIDLPDLRNQNVIRILSQHILSKNPKSLIVAVGKRNLGVEIFLARGEANSEHVFMADVPHEDRRSKKMEITRKTFLEALRYLGEPAKDQVGEPFIYPSGLREAQEEARKINKNRNGRAYPWRSFTEVTGSL